MVATLSKPLIAVEAGYAPPGGGVHNPLNVDHVREMLYAQNEMAVGHLIYAALQHASEGLTHTDRKLVAAFNMWRSMSREESKEHIEQVRHVALEVKNWMIINPVKAVLMVIGLGGTAYKAKTIAQLMQGKAESFIQWGQSASTTERFLGFVGLMTIRLFVSTVVPPTSPAFGVILQAATPISEKWTAMPFFLAASTVAGAMPYAIDKLIQAFLREDFRFTKIMKAFVDNWPLTCWTGPTMQKVFQSVGGGKMGASLAVIVAHAAPFMGAQTTNMQRYFLPHPLDTIISQPFGMSEDLISMAIAEATSSPVFASISLTAIMVAFNLAQFAAFSGLKDRKALLGALLNIFIGVLIPSAYEISGMPTHSGLMFVGFQLLLQMFVMPAIAGMLSPEEDLGGKQQDGGSADLEAKPQRKDEHQALLNSPCKVKVTTVGG